MSDVLSLLFLFAGFALAVFFFLFIFTSIREYKPGAAWRAAVVFLPLLALVGGLVVSEFPGKTALMCGLLACGLLVAAVLLSSWGNPWVDDRVAAMSPMDERDAIFSRFLRLKPGMRELDLFYESHPELKPIDDKIRKLPGLMGSKAGSFDLQTTLFNTATFDVMEQLYKNIDWAAEPLGDTPVQDSAVHFTQRVKGFAHFLGADLVGVTALDPAFIYSNIGRSPGPWGEKITLNHRHAIVIGVKMDDAMIRHAPHHAATTESAFRYMKAGQTALVLSRFIQRLGYPARAHIDGNYRVLCGPLAVSAGLGELSRMGLVVTPEFGPRVRFAVVTTDLPLEHDAPIQFGVQDFCKICKKCATNCPSGAIEKGEKRVVRGVKKWQSSQEACYQYWNRVGSDCSVCIKVCPYSHPNTSVHELIRWAIQRNPLMRRVALMGDDFFYGRRPKSRAPLPDWHRKTS